MKLWLSICAILLFAAGGAVGMLASMSGLGRQNTGTPSGGVGDSVIASMVDPDPDYPLYLVSVDECYDELGLAQDQRVRLDGLFGKYFQSVGEVRASMATVAGNLREGILTVLTAEQTEVFKEIQKRYSATKRRYYIDRELLKVRQALAYMGPEQEAAVYKSLYDASAARHKVCSQRPRLVQCEFRKQMQIISEKRDRRLQQALSESQFAAYRQFKEGERRLRSQHERKTRGKDDRSGDKTRDVRKSRRPRSADCEPTVDS